MSPLNAKIINELITLLVLTYVLLMLKGVVKSKIDSSAFFQKNKKWLIIVLYILIVAGIIKIVIDFMQR